MEREKLERFLNKDVKLLQKDNWALYGRILELSDESLIFKTKDRESVISLDFIAMVVEKEQ